MKKTLKRIWTALLGPTTDYNSSKLLRLPNHVSYERIGDYAWVTLHRDEIRGTETHLVEMKRFGDEHILLDLGALDASPLDPQPPRWREVAADGGPMPDDTSRCDRIHSWWPEKTPHHLDSTERMCESGCGPAVTSDSEGVPLCQACADELARESNPDAKP